VPKTNPLGKLPRVSPAPPPCAMHRPGSDAPTRSSSSSSGAGGAVVRRPLFILPMGARAREIKEGRGGAPKCGGEERSNCLCRVDVRRCVRAKVPMLDELVVFIGKAMDHAPPTSHDLSHRDREVGQWTMAVS